MDTHSTTKAAFRKVVTAEKNLGKVIAGLEADTAESLGFASIGHMRWHWTGNKDNPNKVTQTEYADATGVTPQAVSKSVRAYTDANAVENVKVSAGGRPVGSGADADDHADAEPKAERGDVTTPTRAAREVLRAAKTLARSVAVSGKPGTKGYAEAVSEAFTLLAALLADAEGEVADADALATAA